MSLQHAVYAVLISRRCVILKTECKNFLCKIVCLEVEPQKGVEDGRFACCGHVSSGVDDCFEPRTVSIQEGSDSGSRTSVIMQESGSPVTSSRVVGPGNDVWYPSLSCQMIVRISLNL